MSRSLHAFKREDGELTAYTDGHANSIDDMDVLVETITERMMEVLGAASNNLAGSSKN